MNKAAYSQNFILTTRGLDKFVIGDTLDLKKNQHIKPADERDDYNKIRFWDVQHFNYYYINTYDGVITIDSTIEVNDLFIGVTKTNVIQGIIFFAEKNKDSLLVQHFNNVFGSQQLEATTSAEQKYHRTHKFWSNGELSIFITSSSLKLLKVTVHLYNPAGIEPGINFTD